MPIQKLEYSNTRFGFDIKMSRIGEKSVIICMYWHPAVLVGYSMYIAISSQSANTLNLCVYRCMQTRGGQICVESIT